MTARELIAEYRRCGPQELTVFLHFIADRVHELRFESGARLNDASDFAAMLRELAEAARMDSRGDEWRKLADYRDKMPQTATGQLGPRTRTRLDFCPDCGHAHRGDSECEEPTGAGRTCRCERKVTA